MRIYPKTIDLRLHNRYNEPVSLEQVKGAEFKLKCEDSYIRCVFEEDNKTIIAVDPSGGPFLTKGYAVTTEYQVDRIYHSIAHQGFIVVLKHIENEINKA